MALSINFECYHLTDRYELHQVIEPKKTLIIYAYTISLLVH
jgi:hypothetical protein